MNSIILLELLFILALLFVGYVLRLTENRSKVLMYCLVFHTFTSVLYWQYSQMTAADATMYYETARTFSGRFLSLYDTGTNFIRFVCYPFANVFEVSYFSLFMLFNFFGFAGICFFYVSVLEQLDPPVGQAAERYLNLFLFIPGLNFWTSAIGKDSLIFLGVGMLLYSLSKLHQRVIFLCLSLLVIFHVRPHVFLLVIISLIMAFMLRKGFFRISNMVLLGAALLVAFLTKDAILEKAGVGVLDDISTGTDYLDKRQALNQGGGASLDISQYNFFMKIFAYLYRPLFFDASSATMLAASLENALYLFLTIHLVTKLPFMAVLRERRLYVTFGLVFFTSMLIIMSWSTANLGIAVRQKTMFTPVLIAVYCIAYSRSTARRSEHDIPSCH